jgi:hypothetical protein
MSPPVAGAAATSGDGSPRELYTIPASSGKNSLSLSLDASFFPVVLLLGLRG